jgi:hypothetical protein
MSTKTHQEYEQVSDAVIVPGAIPLLILKLLIIIADHHAVVLDLTIIIYYPFHTIAVRCTIYMNIVVGHRIITSAGTFSIGNQVCAGDSTM